MRVLRTHAGLLALVLGACGTSTRRPAAAPVAAQPQLAPIESSPTETFSLNSSDGHASINGQVDFPPQWSGSGPVVLMVAGTGVFDREVHFAADMMGEGPFDERGLLFTDLSTRLLKHGLATARFDKRGVSCNAVSLKRKDPQATGTDAMTRCLDAEQRHRVTPETIRDDIETVYRHLADHPRLDGRAITVFAHSEGTIHVSHLVAQKRIEPRALAFVGAVTESPKAVVRWQSVDRNMELLRPVDRDADGTITQAELDEPGHHPMVPLLVTQVIAANPTLRDAFTIERIQQQLVSNYDTASQALADVDDGEPYGNLASMRWWKMWFFDEEPVVDLLASFSGPIVLHYGEIDFQTPATREIQKLESVSAPWANRPTVVVHPGLGHSLGPDPIYGPMDEAAGEQLAEQIADVSRSTAR